MRINKYVALATGMSRRAADKAIEQGEVTVNHQLATPGQDVRGSDRVSFDGRLLEPKTFSLTLTLNKPVGYVTSRKGQGSQTIYDLLPTEFHHLKPVGRLDKDSSGLLLLTNDGNLAQQLTHPSFQKKKVYMVQLHKPLTETDKTRIEQGVELGDGVSHLSLKGANKNWAVTMSEGRNRQIRRTFASLGYNVVSLQRTQFGPYGLNGLKIGEYKVSK